MKANVSFANFFPQLSKENDKLSEGFGALTEEKANWKKADEEYKLERENLKTTIRQLRVW